MDLQEHLIKIFNRFSMRKDLVNRLIIDVNTHIFRDDVSEEERWNYYNRICKELKIKDKLIRSHGMKSDVASSKKIKGHNDESFFKNFGYQIQTGTKKTDLTLNGQSFASVKGGEKIQWGMHVINKLPENLKILFKDWISTYEKNFIYLENRIKYASIIIDTLSDKDKRYNLVNHFFRKNENIPFLIVKDVSDNIFYRINYEDLINVISENIKFYTTKNKVKIVSTININNKDEILFEIEPRTDKNNALLIHGQSKVIIKIIKHYNLDVKETYKQNTN
jgi:hypothetical protein